MQKKSIHINTIAHGSKGSALILVVVLTVLLAAVGVLFLMTSRIDEMATSGISRTEELRAGVNVVLDRIGTVLTDDLLGSDDLMLNGDDPCAPDVDEYWDYPGNDDPWLANLEPEVFNDGGTPGDPTDDVFTWPHITDLYDNNFYVPGSYIDHEGTGVPVSPFDLSTEIIGENDPVGYVEDLSSSPPLLPWGNPADADGDGVADSRWIALPGITSSGGEYIYAAVRIIDNCGMININTAYRNPTGTNPFPHPTEGLIPSDWDGSLLAHVNLERIISSTDFGNGLDATAIQALRYGNTPIPSFSNYQNDWQYEFDVSRQMLNHVPGYLPFDIGDELELRNRYFLTSLVVNRFGYEDSLGNLYGWPATFDPGTGTVGRRFPYEPGEDEYNWFLKATSPQSFYTNTAYNGICNRRHISTTYSFDRVIAPGTDSSGMPGSLRPFWNTWTNFGNLYRPVYINDGDPCLLPTTAAAIWLGLRNAEIPTRFGPDYDREILAWQFAVNLADYRDDDGAQGDNTDEIPSYLQVSLSNGDNVDFYGVEHIDSIRNNTLCISEIGYRDETTGPPTIGQYYAVEIYNPSVITPHNLSGYEIWIGGSPPTVISLSGTINPGSVAVVGNQADPCDMFDAFGGTFTANYNQDTNLSFSDGTQLMIVNNDWRPSENVPVDCINIPSGFVSGASVDIPYLKERNEEIGTGTRLLTVVDSTSWPDGTPNPGLPGSTLGDAPTIDPKWNLQLDTNNNNLAGVGEIENVFAAGYYYNISTGQCSTLVKSISRAIELLGSDSEPDIPASNMRSYGRIRLSDPNYHGLFKYLTYFNPFSDGVDNNDNVIVDEAEELAMAGRININTAPWFVIKQIPWVAQTTAGAETNDLARAIAAWRDRLDLSPDGGPDYTNRQAATGIPANKINEEPGFRNIGELLQVINTSGPLPDDFDIRKYLDGAALGGAPDFSTDSVTDDFEERDIIFQRLSNLATVRSDVFTAYILVRIGQDGPQKRMIAIFDRSGVFSRADRPKLVALHPVPDPR